MLLVKSRIENGELSDLKKEVKEKLIKVAEWRSSNPEVDIIAGFDEDVFEEFCASENKENGTEDDDCKILMDDELKVSIALSA